MATDRYARAPSAYPPVDDPRAYGFNAAYLGTPAWDIGGPQPAFVRLLRERAVEDPVLDLGCGTGELSLYLARLGHRVLGVDFAPLAVRAAREKARWRGVDARFLVWDALDLASLAAHVRFGTVTDSAMLHCLPGSDRERVVAGLETVLRPGGRYYVLTAKAHHEVTDQPGWVSRPELSALFADWELEFVRESAFRTRYGAVPAYLTCARRP